MLFDEEPVDDDVLLFFDEEPVDDDGLLVEGTDVLPLLFDEEPVDDAGPLVGNDFDDEPLVIENNGGAGPVEVLL